MATPMQAPIGLRVADAPAAYVALYGARDDGGPSATPGALAMPAETADGVPPLASYPSDIARAAELLAGGAGPFAIDAERASGFRYSNRAYLVQIRRAGAGSALHWNEGA